MRFLFCTVLTVLLASAGCYAYLPVSRGAPAPGSDLRLALTDSGRVALTASVGPFVTAIDGNLAADSGDTYLLNVARTINRDGAETDWRGEKVAVPHAFVRDLAMRRFAPARTAMVSALTGGALAILGEAFSHAGNTGGATSGGSGITHSGR